MSAEPVSGVDPAVVGIVAVGDELIAGAHPDLNSPFLAHRCLEFGRRVHRIIVGCDEEEDIAAAVTSLAQDSALVFVSGGLGPTLDGVTRHGVAKALGVELYESEEAWAEVRGWFERSGRPLHDSNRRQALIPVGSERVANAYGTAPGFRAQHPSGATVIVGPGPPAELQGVFEAEIVPWLRAHSPDDLCRVQRVLHFGDLPESAFAEAVGDWMARDSNPLVGVTVKHNVLAASTVATAPTEAEAIAMAEARAAEIQALFPERFLGEDVQGLGAFVGGFLAAAGITFSVAESCTGGLVAGALTDAPGVSSVFAGSYVTYADERKTAVLGVPSAMLEAHGAVSVQVVEAMARGVLERDGAQLAVAISGVAGPGGGTDEKPVGLVWFGLATRQPTGEIMVRTVERRWPPFGRDRIREWAKNKALGLLLEGARALG